MKVFLKTYGCRANQYDSEALRAMLAAAGAEETAEAADADFAVFNSCTVTASAEADLRSDVRAVSRNNPQLKSIIMGCAAGLPNRNEQSAPLRTLPGIAAVIPGGDVAAVGLELGLSSDAGSSSFASHQSGARALLRIQDGCDEHCTFCATTIARGANRSRSIDALVEEAAGLAVNHPEIVITGIHIGTYGRDMGSSLGELVEILIDRVPQVRFRLSSLEATEVDDRLASLLTSMPERLAPHLHAPLQSGSDAVLKRMGRHWYNALSYERAVTRLTDTVSDFALSADVIVGFPGETDADHRETVSLIERLPFTSLHVFPYSPRPGTAALRLGNAVTGTTVRERSEELRALARTKADGYASSRIGRRCDVVVISRGKGLTGDYLSVTVPTSIPRRSRFRALLAAQDGILIATPETQTAA
jgi:threonylcarbamoyladenosine tRNA methylthiotransferase MtaB